MTVKASTTDMCDLAPMQFQERAATKYAFLRLFHRKCMGLAVMLCEALE